jgi:hypothetical protein
MKTGDKMKRSIEDAVIDLYLQVKIRKQDEVNFLIFINVDRYHGYTKYK